MAQIKFSSGEVFSFDGEVSVYEAAQSLGIISREVITCKVNGTLTELSTPISEDVEVELLTFKSEDGRHVFRHTAAHIMAQAVKRLYPEAKLTIGPAIEAGFYYDFDSDVTFTPDVLMSLGGLAFKNGLYIYLMRQFFKGVPDELEESAYVDGSGVFRTFFTIILPISVPMMITVFLFAFSWQWNDDFYTTLFFGNQFGDTKTYLMPDIYTVIPDSLRADSFAGISIVCLIAYSSF